MMYSPMATAVDRLDSCFADDPSILDWSCPVPFFGDISSARIATVGINPSNREFVDASGHALDFVEQRLPTLGSLGVACWGDVDATHVRAIVLACRGYFERNPYDRWFGVLERVLRLAGVTKDTTNALSTADESYRRGAARLNPQVVPTSLLCAS